MDIDVRLVEPCGFAVEASGILSAAWPLPAFRYSPEYLHWQFSFPGPWPALAVAAFHGAVPIAFAGSTHRRIRRGGTAADALIVSFVAVLPQYRRCGVALRVYEKMLDEIRARAVPVITYAQSGSNGQRAIEHAYRTAGFHLDALGIYPIYACSVQADDALPDVRSANVEDLRQAIDASIRDPDLLCSAPTDAQLAHYRNDPRGRELVCCASGAFAGATAATGQTEYVSVRGVDTVPTLDTVWVDRAYPDALAVFARAAAFRFRTAVPSSTTATVVNAPNLYGFDPRTVRQFGFRQVATPFQGYLAVPSPDHALVGSAGTNLEIV